LWFADESKLDLVELLALDLCEIRQTLFGFAEWLTLEYPLVED
jgi:hypothetical protein